MLDVAMTSAIMAAAIFTTQDAHAAAIEGVTLPPTITYSGRQLQLAGCGTREMMFFVDAYVISIYLPEPPADAATIMDPSTAKLVRLKIVYSEAVPHDLPDEWRSRLEDEISAEMVDTLQGVYTHIHSGDVVAIGYAPDSGTTIRVNGDTVVARSGNTLIDAMLELWIGDIPTSGNLKRLLLQTPCS
ncbi:MAG: chalcone isomerase family protein [Geminicoccaceae bacterium]